VQVWDLILRLHARFGAHLTVQYVPGHVGVPEQEESDTAAKEAMAECDQADAPLSLGVAAAILRAQQRTDLRAAIPEGHLWHRATGGKEPKHDLPRPLQRALSQLRAGRSPLTGAISFRFGEQRVKLPAATAGGGLTFNPHGYVTEVARKSAAAKAKVVEGWRIVAVDGKPVTTRAEAAAALQEVRLRTQKAKKEKKGKKKSKEGGKTKKADKEEEDGEEKVVLKFNKRGSPRCAGCGAAVDDTEHLVCRCPAYAAARMQILGGPDPPLTVLQSDPWKVVRYLRKVGRLSKEMAAAVDKAEATAEHLAQDAPGDQNPPTAVQAAVKATDQPAHSRQAGGHPHPPSCVSEKGAHPSRTAKRR
jgi:hypothetical protein